MPKSGRPNEIRLGSDARAANKAIVRERHVTPSIEDLIIKLNGATYFSKFDLKNGYNQVVLSGKSRNITTFCTHIGLFRYKRLNFGVNAASELFQKAVEYVLSGLKNVINISDDIIVFGKTKDEHEKALEMVLQRLEESGLTVNRKKCQFSKKKLDFFGLTFSSEGIKLDQKKV